MKEDNKKNKLKKNTELRVLIIGEAGIGKKSITKRFKLLNCTETKEKPILKIHSETKEEKKTSNFLNEFDEISEGELYEQKREEQRLNLMKFSKIYKIEFNSIEITFYPLSEAEPLPLNYIPDDEKSFEEKNKISLKKLNHEITQIIIAPLSHRNNHLEILFFFCFDLSNIKSFTQLQLYYSQIHQKFDLENNYHSILVGNKLDKKNNVEFEKNIYAFLEKTNLKYYEISTFMFFNFELFFENVFFHIFEKYKNISAQKFKNIFHNILIQKPTFLQSERKFYEKNLNPSPNEYKNNQYEYPNKNKELFKLFTEKEKYNKGIFIHKEGPVFPPLPKKNIFKEQSNELSFDNNNKTEDMKLKESKSNNDIFKNEYNITKIDLIKENGPIIWDNQRQNEIKDLLNPISKKKGYSLGILFNSFYNLKNKRREKSNKINLKINTAFDNGFNIIRRNKPGLKGALSQEKKKNKMLKKKVEKLKRKENKNNKRHIKNMQLNNDIIQKKIKICQEKENKYIKKFIKRQKEKLAKKKKIQKLNILHNSPEIKKIMTLDAPFYNITTNFSKDKGFSFGHKLQSTIKVYSPEFPNLLDDFEKIIMKNSKLNTIARKGAERFQRTKSDIYEDLSDHKVINRQQKIFEIKRKKFIKNKLSDFFRERKIKLDLVKQNKIIILKDEENDFNEQLIKQYKTANDYFAREINYNLVENSSPKYTIKGKYQYHPSLSYQSYYGSSDDIFNSYENFENFENFNENRAKKKFKKQMELSETPNFDIGKPKYPAFSFGNAERFNDIKRYNSENDLFKDGNFGYQDTKSFLTTQTMMGTETKFRCYKDNGVPGPGNYTIKNFAEEISVKGDLINQIRERIKEKRKKSIFENGLKTYKNSLKKKKNTKNIDEQINND